MAVRRSEPALFSIRRQAALARTLLDELEDFAPTLDQGGAPRAQAIEELTRLGCRIFEAAALLASQDEEADEGPHLSRALQTHAETEPVGEGSAEYARAAIDRVRG